MFCCSARASHCGGFSCGALAIREWASVRVDFLLAGSVHLYIYLFRHIVDLQCCVNFHYTLK